MTSIPERAELPDGWPTPAMARSVALCRPRFRGQRALVTGAFGFVGGHIVRALLDCEVHVTALDCDTGTARGSQLNATGLRQKTEVVQADITDRAAMRELVHSGHYNVIYHIAAGATTIEKALSDPYATIMANTMGFVNLAQGARLLPEAQRPVLIYSSTDKVYGECDELPYVEEKTNLGGVGVYDAAKLAADIFAATYHKALGVPTIVLRMCNLFGPYDYNFDYRLVPKAMRNIFRDREAPELYLNALEHFRDYLYVEDAARAFLHLAYQPLCRGRVYNLPGAHYSATPDVLREIVELVAQMQDEAQARHPRSDMARMKWNRSIRVVQSDPKLITISKQHLDGTRIGREADFEPGVAFSDGLRRTATFYHWYFTRVAPEKPARSDVHHSGETIEPVSPGEHTLFSVITPPPHDAPHHSGAGQMAVADPTAGQPASRQAGATAHGNTAKGGPARGGTARAKT